jgi:hypothetical protein
LKEKSQKMRMLSKQRERVLDQFGMDSLHECAHFY